MTTFNPTDYQRMMYALVGEWASRITEPPPSLADEMPDNGDGESNLIINVAGFFSIIIPPEPVDVSGDTE